MRSLQPNATFLRRIELHDGLMLVHLAPDGGVFPPFKPGQYVSVGRVVDDTGTPQLVKRSYSIGSSANERAFVELFVVHVDDGSFTEWLFRQREGDRVWLSPRAAGGFTLDGFAHGRDLVLVSTGTGVAPYVSMLRTHGENPPWRRIAIVNGVRRAGDLGYRAELEAAAARDPNFIYLPLTTREPEGSDWPGERGRVGDMLEPDRFERRTGIALDPARCHVYLCGNPEMVESLDHAMTARGFHRHTRAHPGNLHMEKYWTD